MELKKAINNIEDVLTNYHANTILRDRLLPVLTFLRELQSPDSNEVMKALRRIEYYSEEDKLTNSNWRNFEDEFEDIKNFILNSKHREELADNYNLLLNNSLGKTLEELAELKEKVSAIEIEEYGTLTYDNAIKLKKIIALCKGSE